MTSLENVTYFALRTVDAIARNDQTGCRQIRDEIEENGFEGFDVAVLLAETVLGAMKSNPNWREQLDQMLSESHMFAELSAILNPDELRGRHRGDL